MGPRSTLTIRLLTQRRDEILGELRALAPELVKKLEQTLDALTEQKPERGEYEGLGRSEVIRTYLLKVGRPVELREIRDAVASPASHFDGRSIWDGGKREVEQGRLFNVADVSKGEDWVLSLPEWEGRSAGRGDDRLAGVPLAVADHDQPYAKRQRSPNDGADGAVVRNHVAGKVGDAQQGDNVGGKTKREKPVVHVVEGVGKPSEKQGDYGQSGRGGGKMGQSKAGQHGPGKGANGSGNGSIGGVT
jgi:hypothetical protein